jgi:DNA modification methylase
MADAPNLLFYGDNLDVLRGHFQDGRPYIADESVDLIYLDPPFNSQADYNAFLPEKEGTRAAARLRAFKDTWTWDEAAPAYFAFMKSQSTPDRVREAMLAFNKLIGPSSMLAYLTMMAPRLLELRRVLEPTGSIYLHCDPTASHYLKVLLDAIFGPKNFKNEITWKRHNARSSDQRWPRVHDVIFFYGKETPRFELEWVQGEASKLPHTLITAADGMKYQTFELTAAGTTRSGETGQPWRGFDPTAMGRHWANIHSTMEAWDAAGLIHWPKGGGFPRRRAEKPFDESRLIAVGDVWTDIDRINQSARERLGYPTQKPLALLDRILKASSTEGDLVLDPFCGCGTTVEAAEKLHRRWIGIDITAAATTLIKERLRRAFGAGIARRYKVIGEPVSVPDAESLARNDPYQFQWWALGLIGARPVEQKKGGDRGIDGKLFFHDDAETGASNEVVFSVKAGQSLNPGMVRDLGHVVDREKAAIGVLLTIREPTAGMRSEAAGAGSYHAPWDGKSYPRLQILTVSDLLAGKKVDLPPSGDIRTFKKAPKVKRAGPKTGSFFDGPES